MLTLVKTMPIKTGCGEKSSTNYHPVFAIAGWVPRGDLAPHPKANGSGQAAAQAKPRPLRAAQLEPHRHSDFILRRFRLIIKIERRVVGTCPALKPRPYRLQTRRNCPVDIADKTRLSKLLGMLGSSFDGERANAAAMIQKMAEKYKLTITELVAASHGVASYPKSWGSR